MDWSGRGRSGLVDCFRCLQCAAHWEGLLGLSLIESNGIWCPLVDAGGVFEVFACKQIFDLRKYLELAGFGVSWRGLERVFGGKRPFCGQMDAERSFFRCFSVV